MGMVASSLATAGLAASCLAVAVWRWQRERKLRLRLQDVEAERTALFAAQEGFKQLADSRDSIFQSAPLCMISTNSEGIITAMNASAERLTGYHREELVGSTSITILHDEKELDSRAEDLAASGRPAAGDDRFAVLTSNASRGEVDEREWNYVRRDGIQIPISLAMRSVTSETGAITGYVAVASDISERKQMLARMTHLATHDHLTKLAGRALLHENIAQAVERARRYGTRVAVFLIDLDQLKRVNDLLGHTSGDKVLIEVAGRLRRAVRSSDTVARVGGDEFVVVMPDIMNFGDVEQCGINLIQRISPPMTIDEHEVHVTASVGASIYPDFAADAKHLLKRADAAMYAAKEDGRNQCRIFSEGMLKETADRLSMEHVLRHALANGELTMSYQPQVSLVTGAVIGMEALLRWTHPKLGQVPPSLFIPLAEETGLIVPIGAWAFKTACSEAMKMREELEMDLTVAVNLSPRQFQQKNLLQVIENALHLSRLPAGCLEIEITENMVMLNSESNLDKLQKIRELGARIAIDDFGTGFCNFTYLLQYQVDRLKIDQSFVRRAVSDLNAAAVVRTIIAMSHGLNMKVVAEGVETEDQLRFLLRRRCDEAQGRLFSGPVPAAEFVAAVQAMSGTDAMEAFSRAGLRI